MIVKDFLIYLVPRKKNRSKQRKRSCKESPKHAHNRLFPYTEKSMQPYFSRMNQLLSLIDDQSNEVNTHGNLAPF